MARDELADGFTSICIDPNLNFLADGCSLIYEGQYVVNNALAQPIVADALMAVDSPKNVDTWFGAGTPLAEALKIAFCTCPVGTKIRVIPRQDAGGATAAVYTTTITGPADSDGVVDIWLGDVPYSVSGVQIEEGDDVEDIATAIVAAVPASCPYTAAVIETGITWTSKVKGTIGNYLNPVVNWKGRANYFPDGVAMSTVRTTAGAGNPAPLAYASLFGTCCFDCYAALTDDAAWQDGVRDYIRSVWDCTKPQCFGHGYTWNNGSLGQVQGAGDNSPEFNRIAYPVNDVNFPWALTAAYAALSCCNACDDAVGSIQGPEMGRLACIYRPATCSEPWSFEDAKSLRAEGFVVYLPLSSGSGVLTQPYITNDVTNYLYDDLGRPNLTYRDTSSRRRAKVVAIETAAFLRQYSGMGLFSSNTDVQAGVKGTSKRLIDGKVKAWARSQVGRLFSQFDNIDRDITLRSDGEVQRACFGRPCDFWLNIRYRDPCRINKFNVNAQPLVFDNCDRR